MKPSHADLESEKNVERGKRPYTTPTLTEHGDIETITGAGGLSGTDVPVGSTLI